MRETYESDDSINRELRFESWYNDLAHKSLAKIVKLPKFYAVDFAKINTETNQVLALIEVKGLRTPLKDLRRYSVSAKKVQSIIDSAKALKVAASIAVIGQEGIYMIDDPANFYSVRWGGKTLNQRDFQDIELMCDYKPTDLRFITEKVKF